MTRSPAPPRLPRQRSACALAALLLALAAPLALAPAAQAQFGQLRGTVTDAATGEPLPGVNVIVDGPSLGAATDLNGQYIIIGLRPDTYTVVFSYIGYQPVRIEGVRVRIDLTTPLDVQLREEVIEGGEVVVTAERALVQRDLTATTAFVGAEEIRALPVENFAQVVELQAGVVNGHFRGGRLGEVGYWVDGLPVQDVYDGGLALGIENDMVQEAQIVTGAFNAEFGQAMSGIVNVVTRDGGNRFEGSFSGFVGDYLTRENTLPTGLPVFPDLGGFSGVNVQNYEGSLSGPIVRNRLFFVTTGRYFRNDGWIIGRDLFRSEDLQPAPEGSGGSIVFTGASGDSSAVALNPYERLGGQAKLTAQLWPGVRLSANVIAGREEYRDFDLSRFFFPTSQPLNRRDSYASYLKLTHALSARTFYEVGVTNNYTEFARALFDDPMDPRYRDEQFFGFTEPLLTSNFFLGGTDNARFSRATNTWLAKADLSSQINRVNLVKVGVEARFHTLNYRDERVVVEGEGSANRNQYLVDNGTYRYQPFELSAYAQDKIELGDLIINAGIRLDYFDASAPVFRDPTDPNAVFTNFRRCREIAGNRCAVDDQGNELLWDNIHTPDAYFQPATAKWQLSPRLGVAFPVTEGGVFHVSYGWFFQRPAFERLYQNPYFQLGAGGSGLIGLIGNADLNAEQTISGEIGLKQQLSTTSALEVTAYYRDIRNLTGTAVDPIQIQGTGARYGRLANSDFGFVRGIILRYDQRIGRMLFGGINYTFQVARANASDPNQSFSAAAALGLVERRILPTDWDQMHTASVSVAYQNPDLEAGFGIVLNVGSGTPYTPFQLSDGAPSGPGRILLNSEIKPAFASLDLNANKTFRVADRHEVQVFTQMNNLFDARNQTNVYGDTGSATYTLQRNIDLRAYQGNVGFLDRWYTRPGFYSEPRRVVFGLRYGF